MSGAPAGSHATAPAETDDADIAAAWGASLDDAGDASPGEEVEAARVLNQAEIDSLLGFDGGGGAGDSRTGMQRILSSGLVSYERLPMLEGGVRPAGPVDVDHAAQLHQRQRGSRHRQQSCRCVSATI